MYRSTLLEANAGGVIAGPHGCATAVQHMCKCGQESKLDVCNCIGDVNIWSCEAHLAPEGVACAARASRLISLLPEQAYMCETSCVKHTLLCIFELSQASCTQKMTRGAGGSRPKTACNVWWCGADAECHDVPRMK